MAVIAGTGVVLRPANIRSALSTGSIFTGSAAANTYYQTIASYVTTTGFGASVNGVAYTFKSPFAGSVVGASLTANGTSATQFLRVLKNGTTLVTFTMGTGTGFFSQNSFKGTYPFASGDYLQIYLAQSVAGSMYSHAHLMLDYAQ